MSIVDKMDQSAFTLLAEIDPPKGVELEAFMDRALSLKGRVDGLIVTDCEDAILRMSPSMPCVKLRERNMEAIMSVTGRDRNRISLQADMLGAASMGIGDIKLKLGHDPAVGDQPLVRSSGDLDLETMLKCAQALNKGKDLGGEPLEGATSFAIGASVEVSDDIHHNRHSAENLGRLAELGAQYVVLGPTYDMNILELFAPYAEQAGLHLFGSVMLLKSVAMIRYLNNLPGAPAIPHEYLKKMMDAQVKAQAGVQIAAEFVKEMQSLTKGAVLLSLGWGVRLPEFLDLLGR